MQKKIVLYNSARSVRHLPDHVTDFVGFLIKILEEVPAEHHEQVEIEFDSDSDSCSVDCIIFYHREETPEEQAEREAKIKANKEHYRAREYANYLKLKATFEPDEKNQNTEA